MIRALRLTTPEELNETAERAHPDDEERTG
jgi:hypothetical protein